MSPRELAAKARASAQLLDLVLSNSADSVPGDKNEEVIASRHAHHPNVKQTSTSLLRWFG